jgi:hypothetical protein
MPWCPAWDTYPPGVSVFHPFPFSDGPGRTVYLTAEQVSRMGIGPPPDWPPLTVKIAIAVCYLIIAMFVLGLALLCVSFVKSIRAR